MRNLLAILAGITLIALSTTNIYLNARQAFSPFDVADAPAADVENAPLPSSDRQAVSPSVLPATREPDASQLPATDLQNGEVATPAPRPAGLIPTRIVIPSINVDVEIVPVTFKEIKYEGTTYTQWNTPKFAVGWHDLSAKLGLPGNTVFNGHHNSYGEVFKHLVDLRQGDLITVYSDGYAYEYKVATVMLLAEKYRSVDERQENARWIQPSDDERLTLITCWPPTTNTHRVIVVAYPVK